MGWKKRILLFTVLLFAASIVLGMAILRSDKAQLSLQVGATSHIKKILPLLPEDFIDHKVVIKYSQVLEEVLKYTEFKVISHEKKTNNTGVATIEVVVPVVCRQVSNALLTSTDESVQSKLSLLRETSDIDMTWLLDMVTEEIDTIDFSIAQTKTLTLEVSTYAMKGKVWSFSKDALEEATLEIYYGMGFNEKWREQLLTAIP